MSCQYCLCWNFTMIHVLFFALSFNAVVQPDLWIGRYLSTTATQSTPRWSSSQCNPREIIIIIKRKGWGSSLRGRLKCVWDCSNSIGFEHPQISYWTHYVNSFLSLGHTALSFWWYYLNVDSYQQEIGIGGPASLSLPFTIPPSCCRVCSHTNTQRKFHWFYRNDLFFSIVKQPHHSPYPLKMAKEINIPTITPFPQKDTTDPLCSGTLLSRLRPSPDPAIYYTEVRMTMMIIGLPWYDPHPWKGKNLESNWPMSAILLCLGGQSFWH